MAERDAGGGRPAGRGRPVVGAKGEEPGRSYFTALARWPDEVARKTRTDLAAGIGCSRGFLSSLLSNSGSSVATPNLLQWAWKIVRECGGGDEDLENWTNYHADVLTFQASGGTGPLPVPPEPWEPAADYAVRRHLQPVAPVEAVTGPPVERLEVGDGRVRALFVVAVEPVASDLADVIGAFARSGYECGADAVVRTSDPHTAVDRLTGWLEDRASDELVAVYVTGTAEITARRHLVLHTTRSHPGRGSGALRVDSLVECLAEAPNRAMLVLDLVADDADDTGIVLEAALRACDPTGTPVAHVLGVVRNAATPPVRFGSAWRDAAARAPRGAPHLDLDVLADRVRTAAGGRRVVGVLSSSTGGSAAWLPNPRHHLVGVDPVELELWWEPVARAGGTPGVAGWLFSGRRKLNREITRWLASPDEPVLVLTGAPGSGKSTVLARTVVATVPDLRAALADVPGALRPEETPPEGFAFALTLHVAGLNAQDVAERVEQAMVGGAGRPSVILVDSLDEAHDPHRVVAEVLRPLAEQARESGPRLLVATRRHPLGHHPADPLAHRGNLVTPLIAGGGKDIDVGSPVWLETGDIAEYCERLLRVHDNDAGRRNPYATDAGARRVLARSIESLARHSFLLAAHVARRHTLDLRVVDSRDPAWKAQFPQKIGDALRQEVEAVYGVVEAARWLALLRPLAFADGAGLVRDRAGPDDLWALLAARLDTGGRTFTRSDVDELLGHRIATHLVSRVQKDGATAYRFHHEALAESFTSGPEQEVAAHRAITSALLGTISVRGARDWSRAGTYLRRALPGHARIAGELGPLLSDAGVFAHCDPDRLHESLVVVRDPDLVSLSHLLRPYLHRLRRLEPAQRAFLLSLAAKVTAQDDLARDLAAEAGLPVTARYVRVRHEALRQALAEGPSVGTVAATTTRDGTRLVFVANGDFIDVRDPASGALVESFLSGLGDVAAMEPFTDEDGFPAVAAAGSGGAQVWDTSTRALRARVEGGFDHGMVIGRRSDGRVFLAGWTFDRVCVWTPAAGANVLTLSFPWRSGSQPITSLALVQDAAGRAVLAVGGGGLVTMWDPVTGHEGDRVDLRGAYNVRLHALRPDLLLITSGLRHPEALLWSSAGGARPWPFPDVPTCVAAWSGDPGLHRGRLVLGYAHGAVRLWDGDPNRAPHGLQDSGVSVQAVAIGPDDSANPAVVAVNGNGEIRVWDLHSLGTTTTLAGSAPHTLALGSLPSGGRYLVLGRSNGADIWRLDEVGHLPDMYDLHDNDAQRIGVVGSGGSTVFVTAGNDGRLNVWSGMSGRVLGALAIPTGYPADVLAGESGGVRWVAVTSASVLMLYDLARSRLVLERDLDQPGALAHTDTSQGSLLAIADRQSIHLLNLATQEFSTLAVPVRDRHGRARKEAERNVTALTWSPGDGDDRVLVAGTQGGMLVAWLLRPGADPVVAVPPSGDGSAVIVLQPCRGADGALILAGGSSGELGLHDVLAGTQVFDLTRDEARVAGATVTAGGAVVTTHVGEDQNTVRVWDPRSGTELRSTVRPRRRSDAYLGRPIVGTTLGGRVFVVYPVEDGVELVWADDHNDPVLLSLPITVNDVDVLEDVVYLAGGGGYVMLQVADERPGPRSDGDSQGRRAMTEPPSAQ